MEDKKLTLNNILNDPEFEHTEWAEEIEKDRASASVGISGVLADELTQNEDLQFPKNSVKGLAKEFADTYSACFESPWGFWAFSFLTCLGITFANKAYLAAGNTPQPRLFTILLGRSGYERKSQALRQTRSFFSKVFPNSFQTCLTIGSAEGLVTAFKEGPKVLLVYDELNNFVNKCSIDGSVLLTCVGSLFEMNQYENHTKRDHLKVNNAYLSLLGACTTETFNQMWKPHFIDIGFINRLWLVPDRGEKRLATPLEISKADEKSLMDAVKSLALVWNGASSKVIRTSPEARDLYQSWYMRQDQSVHNTRLDTYGDRLKVIFCLNEQTDTVDGDMMQRIITLLDWQRVVREVFTPIDADSKIARLEENIRRTLKKHGPISDSELKKWVNAKRTGIWAFETAIKNVFKTEEVQMRQGKYTQTLIRPPMSRGKTNPKRKRK